MMTEGIKSATMNPVKSTIKGSCGPLLLVPAAGAPNRLNYPVVYKVVKILEH